MTSLGTKRTNIHNFAALTDKGLIGELDLVRDSLHGLLCTWSVFLHLVMVESFLIPANKRLGD